MRWGMRNLLFAALGVALLSSCATPARKIKNVKLGMTPEEVRKVMGDPYTIRAAKIYEDGEWAEVWEYLPPPLTLNPKTFWIYFENGKVVQWGEPGDFAGKSGPNVPVTEYSEQKVLR